ncbi:hypothetical protein CW749_22895 [Vibrio sp. vnigr-6D03]|uniref:hypothetical protein n=1 Tax=Vibrio sp. vnigr-6D03 TaxID=2058088 RepID=UPI000C31FE31|nr:hypothetical protein [Vibrio sp. vnigr-6D03]PKF77241.1 hypothetical protein CW749_22895 [Vibrio sp. vnigr-6D03]
MGNETLKKIEFSEKIGNLELSNELYDVLEKCYLEHNDIDVCRKAAFRCNLALHVEVDKIEKVVESVLSNKYNRESQVQVQ